MTLAQFRLCRCGVLLFLFGLIIGFPLQALPNREAALGAHQVALQSGIFLVGMGLLWDRLSFSPKWSIRFANLLWVSFVALQIGLTIPAFLEKSSARGAPQMASLLLNISGSVLMFIGVVAVALVLRKAAPGPVR